MSFNIMLTAIVVGFLLFCLIRDSRIRRKDAENRRSERKDKDRTLATRLQYVEQLCSKQAAMEYLSCYFQGDFGERDWNIAARWMHVQRLHARAEQALFENDIELALDRLFQANEDAYAIIVDVAPAEMTVGSNIIARVKAELASRQLI